MQVCDSCHRFINQTAAKRTHTLRSNLGLARCLIHKYPGTPRWPWYEPDPMANRETLGLVRAFYKIEDADVRQQVRELIRAMGAAGV